MIDTSVLDLIGQDTQLRRVAATNGGEWAGPCPFCGGRDRFRVWPEEGRYWCRGCGKHGDAIAYLRLRDGLGYHEACKRLGVDVGRGGERHHKQQPATPMPHGLQPPSEQWQNSGKKFICEAEAALWSEGGVKAMAYLHGRGLTDETIRDAHLGYNPVERHDDPVSWGLEADHKPIWLPRGIVLPWCIGDDLWRVNIRRPTGDPKYIGPAGSRNALYNADHIRPDRPVALVESEIDALVVGQEAGTMVTAVATGSTTGARHLRWVGRLALASMVLVAYDADEAGDKASAYWLEVLPSAKRWRPYWDDVDQMHQDGVDVRGWIDAGLGNLLQRCEKKTQRAESSERLQQTSLFNEPGKLQQVAVVISVNYNSRPTTIKTPGN